MIVGPKRAILCAHDVCMMRSRQTVLVFSASLALALAACEIRLPEVHVTGATVIDELDRDSDLAGYLYNDAYPGRPELLRIDLRSREDIGQFVNDEHHMTLSAQISVCSGAVQGEISAWPGVYSGDVPLGRYSSTDVERERYRQLVSARPAAAPYSYSVYLRVRDIERVDRSPGFPIKVAYDLKSSPQDLCIALRGGGALTVARTGTIRVDKAIIARALASAPPS
jgi:hypothetical protein